ncbi:MAG TPA: SDR family NAD(P)-dependent oxidoreductase [Vulgatibacter sp.]
MTEDLRTAWISGASSGIGAAVARRLAARGVEVILSARRREPMEELAQAIRAAGGEARVEPLDVTDPEEVVRTLRRLDDEVGGIDLVIANAGVGGSRWAGKLEWQDLANTLDVDVTGAAASLVALLPRMVERGRGHVVGISSLAGYRGMPASAAYGASKAFLISFLESLRVDLRDTGVTVTDVRPGFVRTPLTDRNKFHMPFLVEVDAAAARIVDGISRREEVIAFPWPLVLAVRLSRLIPNRLWDRLAAGQEGDRDRGVFDAHRT